jgi:D-alanyl-D-alanine carboxypeptidase/D-alanyl-D-alanine-endopeptidase (penicillin-binding protein 4)
MNRNFIFKGFFTLLLFSYTASSFSQNPIKDSSLLKLKNEIELLKKDKAFKHAGWSICVMSSKTGKTIVEYNSEMLLTPASTMKVFTTATALSLLGSSFKFETTLQYSGKIDSSGTLVGNIYIKGGGDPTFGSDRFQGTNADVILNSWIEIIKSKGIKKIEGKVIGDAEIFDNILVSPEWSWEDIGNYYGTGACGLSIFENQYHVYFDAGKNIGDSAKIDNIFPEIPYMDIINNVKTGKANSGDNVIIFGSPFSNIRIMEGTMPLGKNNYSVEGSIPDPSYYFAYYFNRKLIENGVIATNPPSTVRHLRLNKESVDTSRIFIAKHISPSLESIVSITNLKSVNTFAEHILKMLGENKELEGTYDAGAKVVENFLISKKIDVAGFAMNDGSGLSPLNRVTTKQMAGFLLQFINDPAYEAFYNSLPVAGKSGSIASLFKGTFAENNLRAKSGFFSWTRAYAGYVFNKSNDLLTFSIIVNNYDCKPLEMKTKLEKLMLLIAELN